MMTALKLNARRRSPGRAFLTVLLAAALLLGAAWPATPARAAFTFPLSETFMSSSASAGWVLGGSAYLTSGNGDPANNGWLRLTKNTTYQAGYAYYNTAIPTGRGLVVTFDYGSWGGSGADGLTFFLFDGAAAAFNVGASGGSLGYAQKTGVNGLSSGYLGLGLDEFGNYSNPNEGRVGGPGFIPEAVAIRGPGSLQSGYTYLAGTKTLAPTYKLDCPKNYGSCGDGASRPADTYYYRQVQITVIPVGSAYQVSVAMKFSKSASSWTTLFGPFTMPTSAPGTLKMGFAASTGGSTNYHEIRNLNVTQQVPDLTATKAVQNATTGGGSVAPSDQLLYTVALINHTGAAITDVRFTDAIPANTAYVANSASVPSGSTLNSTAPLDVTGITVPANGQASLVFKVQVDTPIPVGVTQISNQGVYTYSLGSSQTDGDAVTDGNQATLISVTAGPNFDTTTKTVTYEDKDGNGAVSPGDILTYHVVLPNSGNQNSPTTSFSDVLPANTTYVAGSAAASRGTVSYNSTAKTLGWTVSVDAGSQATLDFKVTVNSGVKIRDVISNQGAITYGATSVLTDADLATPGKQPTQLLVGGVATLAVTKTASVVSPPLQPGGELLYTILLTNTSSYTITGAAFADTLPANTSYVAGSASTTSGSASYTAPAVTAAGISLPTKGATATITFRVTVNNPLPEGVTQVSNQGLVSYDSNNSGSNNTSLQTDGDPATAGQQPTYSDIPNTDLAIAKTVAGSQPAEGETAVYTLVVTNNGPAAAAGVSVNDALPAGLSYASSSASQGSYTSPTWNVGALASGASATLAISATVNLGQGGSTITNTATVSSTLYDAAPGNNSASVGLTVSATTLSGVVRAAGTGSPLANVGVTVTDTLGHTCTATTDVSGAYTVTSGVSGCLLAPGAATLGAVTVPSGYLPASTGATITAGAANTQDLSLVRPSLGGVVTDLGAGVPIVGITVTLSQGAVSCTAVTGAGGAYSFVAAAGAPACNFTAGAATVEASAAGYQTNSQAITILSSGPTTQDLPLGAADLLITKSDGQTVASPGELLSYVLAVVNNGSITATGFTLTDTLPAYLTYDNDDSGVVPSQPSPGAYRWELADLAPGAAMSFTLQARVATTLPDGATALLNYAWVRTASAEKDKTNNEVADIDTVTTHPDLTLVKTFTSDSPALTGSTVWYRLRGSNSGHAAATQVAITDTLDALVTYLDGSASLTINGHNETLTVTYGAGWLALRLPDIAPGDAYVLDYAVTVDAATGSPLENTAVITETETDLNSADNTAGVLVPTLEEADAYVLKSAAASTDPAEPGSQIVYTLAYGNNGSDPAAGVTITDALPANTTLAAGSITGGGTESGGVITWALGSLASRATGVVSFTVQVNSPLPAGVAAIANTAAITTTSSETGISNNTSSTSTPVTAQPDLAISKSDGRVQVLAGDILTYTITYSNTGNQGASGVKITDTLLAGVDYLGCSPGGVYSAGDGTITWDIGGLPVDGPHTLTVSLQVKTSALPASVAADRVTIADDGLNGEDINPAGNTATDSNTVTAPYLVIEKQASGLAYTGHTVNYTITYTNTGSLPASNVLLSDTLPAGLIYVAGSASHGGVFSAGVGTWNLGSLPAGGAGAVTFLAIVDVGAGGALQTAPSLSTESGSGSLVVTSTTATLSRAWCDFATCAAFMGVYQGADGMPPTGWNDNPRMTVFDDAAWTPPVAASTAESFYWTDPGNLSAEWTAVHTAGETFGNFTFFRQAFCLPLNATGLSANLELAGDDVSDIYLNGIYLGQKVGAGAAASFDGAGGIQAGINLLAVQLLNNRHGGHAALGGQDHSGLLFNLQAAYTGLRPFASAPATLLAGQTVQFAADELALGGRAPYSYTLSYGDGSPDAAYQPGSTFTHQYTTAGVYTATLTARAQYGCTGSDQLVIAVLPAGSILLANPAGAAYQDANGASFGAASGAGTELRLAADLSIAKTVLAGGVTPGLGVTYQIQVTNLGPQAVSGAAVSDTLPAAVSGVTWDCAASAGGSCANASGSGSTLSETVDLLAGATATYTLQGALDPAAAGALANTAAASPPEGVTDLVPGNDRSTASTLLTPSVSLTVTKTSSPNPGLAPGRGVSYVIVVSNSGPSDAAAVSVTDTFPAEITALTWTCAASSGSTCAASGSGDLNDTAAIKAGGRVTYTVAGTAAAGATPGTLVANTATAGYGAVPVSATDNNTLVAMTTLAATKDALDSGGAASRRLPFIDADGSGGISPGDTLQYQVIITAGAETAYNLLYNDIPDANTTLAAGSLSCTPACTVTQGNGGGDTAVSVSVASLAGGASVTLTYRVTVNAAPLPFQTATLANQGRLAASNAPSTATDDPATSESGDATVLALAQGAVGGVAWQDDDDDGVKDPGEPLLADLPVTLYYAGADNTFGTDDDQAAYALTDASGVYSFTNLAAGRYQTGFYLQLGYKFSPTGADSQVDSSGLSAELALAANQQMADIDAGEAPTLDFGNLPAAYGLNLLSGDGARHTLGNVLLGADVLAEADGLNTPDLTPAADDNGIVRTPGVKWAAGAGGGSLDVTAHCDTGCYLSGWIDWDNDSSFNQAGDQVLLDYPLVEGLQTVTLAIPAGTTFSTILYARFRLYAASTGGLAKPSEAASNGEVEDYKWAFGPNAVTLERFSARTPQPTGWLLVGAAGSICLYGLFRRRRPFLVKWGQ